jgi:negative regulator of flagellin synthesis FlgM
VKINPSITAVNGGKDAQTTASPRGQPRVESQSGAAGGGDTIHLSTLSSHLHELESSLAAGSPFDAKKVGAITQAIRDGKFSVNAGVVADKLLASTQELLGKKS